MGTLSPLPPLHRTMVAVDIEGSTTRTNPARATLRQVMYEVLDEAFRVSGILEDYRHPLIDRGDGALVLIRPVDQVPKTLVLNTFIPALSDLLAAHNADRPDSAFRLRTAVNAGEVHYDSRGPFGEAVDVTCRLLDAPEFKARLRRTAAPLVLVVSEYIYRSVIWHGYDGIDDRAFEPLVHLEVGGRPQHGWVHVPAETLPYPRREAEFGRHRAGELWLPFVGEQQV
jgi:hypothetical protein